MVRDDQEELRFGSLGTGRSPDLFTQVYEGLSKSRRRQRGHCGGTSPSGYTLSTNYKAVTLRGCM